MDRKLISHRIGSILDDISRLSNALYALDTTDIQRYPDNYETLSIDAALRAERIACRLRHLIYSSTTIRKGDYLKSAGATHGITVNCEDRVLEVTLPEPEEPEARPQNIPLDVVYEDQDVIVVNKPTGMVVHPAPGHPDGTLVNALLYHCGESLSGIGGQKRPGIVHRIDRDTSGLIIAAKNDAAHLALAAQLADHTLARTYECLAVGNFREDSGTVDAPIGRHPTDRKKMCVTQRGGRNAVTHWEVVRRYKGYTHIRCKLETGRTHQIRATMADLGCPLLGDGKYGKLDKRFDRSYQALYSYKLTFTFTTDAGALAYLNGKSFRVEKVDFAEQYFPNVKI